MGNVERCDKTLPTNEMMYYVRRDPLLRARIVSDLPGLAREFGLSPEEVEAIRDQDPRRLMDLGAATARALRDSDWRVALIASSSWSHAFLCDKTWRLYPDMESDRHLFKALERRTTTHGETSPCKPSRTLDSKSC